MTRQSRSKTRGRTIKSLHNSSPLLLAGVFTDAFEVPSVSTSGSEHDETPFTDEKKDKEKQKNDVYGTVSSIELGDPVFDDGGSTQPPTLNQRELITRKAPEPRHSQAKEDKEVSWDHQQTPTSDHLGLTHDDRNLQAYREAWTRVLSIEDVPEDDVRPPSAVHLDCHEGRWRLDYVEDYRAETTAQAGEALEDPQARRLALSEHIQYIFGKMHQDPEYAEFDLSGNDWDRILRTIYDVCSAVDRKLLPLLTEVAMCRIVLWPSAFRFLVLDCCQNVWRMKTTEEENAVEALLAEYTEKWPAKSKPGPKERTVQKVVQNTMQETMIHHETCKRISSAWDQAIQGLERDLISDLARSNSKERHFVYNDGQIMTIDVGAGKLTGWRRHPNV